MIQRAIDAGVSRFLFPQSISTCTQSMYELGENHPENNVLMMVCTQRM
jgi:hypothetical protein